MRNPYCRFLIALLLFGSNGIVAGMISMNSQSIVFFRTMIGAATLIAAYAVITHKERIGSGASSGGAAASVKPAARQKAIVIASGLAMGISWMFLYEAFTCIGVAVSTLIYYAAPIVLMMLSPVLFAEKLTHKKIICFSAVVLGMILINVEGLTGSFDLRGTMCAVMSAVFFVLMLIANKKAAVSGITNSVYQLASSFTAVAVICLVTSIDVQLPGSFSDTAWLIVLGIVNTGIGCLLYFQVLSALPVQSVSVLGYVEPITAVVLAAVILGEHMSMLQIIGAATVIIAAVIIEIEPHALLRPSAEQNLQLAERS